MLTILIAFAVKDFFTELSRYELIIFCAFVFTLLVQLFYYLFFYSRVTLKRKPAEQKSETGLPPVSVVICARDEELNLKAFLPSVLEQDYPNYEVIVVNDCSTDDTDIVLDLFSKKYEHLRVTTIKQDEKFTHGKKLALTVGIKAAKHDWLLLTDADCKAVSNKWLSTMASNFTDNCEIVLGYGGYFPQKGFLNMLIRYDAFFVALQYLSFALAGKPFMGVGRNLAYRKELFFRNKGFASHSHIFSGDDDLFVHQAATRSNTCVEFRHESHTLSNPKETLKAWFKQKRRHFTTGPHYRAGIKLILAIEPFSRILFWTIGIYAMFISANLIWIIAGTLAFRIIVNSVIIKIASLRLNERKIFIPSLVYDLLSPLFHLAVHTANRLTPRRSKWN